MACKNDPPEQTSETTTPATPPAQVQVPRFDADSAYAYVQRQVDFGPRVPNTDTHRATKEWLVSRFEAFGAQVTEQDFQARTYNGQTLNATNIIAQYNPEATDRILLAAHWDTRAMADSPLSTERQNEPIAGADDGGSGVGVLLEIARQLEQNPIPNLGIDIVLFDAEDQGQSGGDESTINTWGLGSQYYSRNLPATAKPRYGILLDMVGARNARFPIEGYSWRFAPEVVRKVWLLANQMGYGNYFVDAEGGGVTDDHYFVNTIARIPMIDIINLPLPGMDRQTQFGEYWHTHNDNMDIIDRRTLRAVGQVLLATIYREAGGTI